MPILRHEENIHPPGLFEAPLAESPWWGAHVRSRQEKKLARHLLTHAVSFYLPLRRQAVRKDGRNLVSYIPLFPGYVFLRGTARERRLAQESHFVARVLEVQDQATLRQELEAIRQLEAAGAAFGPVQTLAPGDRVKVVEGPLTGMTGDLVQAKGKRRYLVTLTMLQRSVLAEVDGDALALEPGSRPREPLPR